MTNPPCEIQPDSAYLGSLEVSAFLPTPLRFTSLLSSMYDTILIPVDLSSTNEHVLRRAQQFGEPDRTQILLLHVIETLQDDEPGEMDDFYEELRAEAEAKMETWAAEVAEHGFDVESVITYGERGPEITQVADDEGADLIVMRSHQVNRDDPESSVGTVSHQVAIFAPCSVHLVRLAEAQ